MTCRKQAIDLIRPCYCYKTNNRAILTMSRLSINQAAKEFGVSRERVRKAIKSNDLTTETGARNAQTLDVVDLIRIFGEPFNRSKTSVRPDPTKTEDNSFYVDKLIESLETQVVVKDKQLQTKDNQIEDYQVRIDYLQGRVEKLEQELATAAKPRFLLPWFK